MSKKLIVFAQKAEAEATLHRLKASAIPGEETEIWTEGKVPSAYTFERGWIVLSNVGIHAGQMAVVKYAHLADEVWNLGLAGALNDELPLGQILTIQAVGKFVPSGELDPYSKHCVDTTVPSFTLKYGKNRLVSSDFPIHDPLHRLHLAKQWDLVDMEGYGIAYAAAYLGKNCRMWKIVSDFASPGGRALIRKNKARLSEQLAETIYETIYESRPHP